MFLRIGPNSLLPRLSGERRGVAGPALRLYSGVSVPADLAAFWAPEAGSPSSLPGGESRSLGWRGDGAIPYPYPYPSLGYSIRSVRRALRVLIPPDYTAKPSAGPTGRS